MSKKRKLLFVTLVLATALFLSSAMALPPVAGEINIFELG